MYGYKLITFFLLDSSDERALPSLFIISRYETDKVIRFCCQQYKNNWSGRSKLSEIEYIMSDMDPVYPNSINNTWRKEAKILYCEWHQNKAIRRKYKLHIPKDTHDVIKKYIKLKNIPNEEEFLLEKELFIKYIFGLNKKILPLFYNILL